MEFLFKSRSQGKRQIKPSQDIQYLEDTFAQESSEDSDFKLDSDHEDKMDRENSSASGSSSSSSDGDSEEDDDGQEDEEDLEEKDFHLTSRDLLGISKQEAPTETDDELLFRFKICACCLGQSSNDANEIVECDGCGVSVHETCYGVTESGSVASNISDASTEPWFCDPCQAGLSGSPSCELCPVIGGVYKETNVGRWVHLICALYVNGVAFGDIDKLSGITLFELNYSNWGKKPCGLCEQSRFSRTGICIQCDAGMCRSSFHATCAQSMGLLAEPIFTETDPYIAHCRLHSDKSAIKSRKRLYAISKKQAERRRSLILQSWEGQNISSTSSRPLPDESPAQRILRKLNRRRARYLFGNKKNEISLPFKKTPRFLSSSSSAIRKTQRLAECATGLSSDRQRAKEAQVLAIQEIQKKWNLSASFNVEFVAYYHDRQIRLRDFKNMLSEQMKSSSLMRTLQSEAQAKCEKMNEERDASMDINTSFRDKIKFYTNTLIALGVTLPQGHDQILKASASGPLNGGSPTSLHNNISNGNYSMSKTVGQSTPLNLKQCGVCSGTQDQHLLIPCDTCHLHYHLGCLNPPLTRMPKRSKLYKWQCSECDKLSSEDEANPVDVSGPRKLRQKRTLSKGGGGGPPPYSSDEDVVMQMKQFLQKEEEKASKMMSKPLNGNSHSDPTQEEPPASVDLDSARAEKKRLKKERKREKKRRKLQNLSEESKPPSNSAGPNDDIEVLSSTEPSPGGEEVMKPIKIRIRTLYENNPVTGLEEQSSFSPKAKKKRLSADSRDVRTFCNKCETSGSNGNLVRCDECKKCYHFSCLIPPVKKSPKVAGYGWHCNECDPSDVDSDWHLD
eukprot:TRINITY_DN25332_c0_g1_i1.p1 TRINITY_DN25332_c0_g1~~TRINITY_DN25332_c0_g1_i1.p1  ORF type:complete len:847 (-),score=233.61 TRINITY_DN25332_c0_g1_i1:526-3066(-)